MNKLLLNLTKYPKVVLAVLFIVTVFFAHGVTKLETRHNFDGELPADDPIYMQVEHVKEIFDERSIVLFGIEGDILSTDGIRFIDDLTRAVEEMPYVIRDDVKSLTNIHFMSQDDWGIENRKLIENLPESMDEMEQIRTDIRGNDNIQNILINDEGTFSVVVASLEDDFDGAELLASAQHITHSLKSEDYRIYTTGAPLLVEDVQVGISKDSKVFMPIAILTIFICFYLLFRNWQGVVFPIAVVVLSIIWTLGAMGYLGLPKTVVSNALPVIMVAVASSYGIHFMYKYFSNYSSYSDRQQRVRATLRMIGPPILVTGITSSLGSISLLIFKIKSLYEFGIIGSLGFIFATVICLTLLPALCIISKEVQPKMFGQSSTSKGLLNLTSRLTSLSLKRPMAIGALYIVVLTISILNLGNIKIGDDYELFFPKSHQSRIAIEKFNENLNGVRVMELVVNSHAEDGIKKEEFYTKCQNLSERIQQMRYVGQVLSYTNILDYMKDQLAESNVMETALTDDEISQYIMLYEMSATPSDVFNLRDESSQRVKMRIFLKTSKPEEHKAIYAKIKGLEEELFGSQEEPTLVFGGDVMNRISLANYIVKGKLENVLLGLFIVFLCCTLIYRSFKKGLISIVPIILSLIMVFGFMGAIGIRLGISTSLLTAMIVGIGIDFSVHYFMAYNKNKTTQENRQAIEKTGNETGKAIFFDAISNMVGFSILSFSGFLPLQHFGWLLAFSMFLIFLNTVLIYPMILEYKKSPKHAFKGITGQLAQ